MKYRGEDEADTAVRPTGENVDPEGSGRAPHRPEDGLVQGTALTQEGDDLLANYNPREVPDTPQAKRISQVAEELYTSLTKVYNYIKGKTPLTGLTTEHQALITELQDLHEQLNDAVCACYSWPEDTWRDENEVLKRLLELNLALTG